VSYEKTEIVLTFADQRWLAIKNGDPDESRKTDSRRSEET